MLVYRLRDVEAIKPFGRRVRGVVRHVRTYLRLRHGKHLRLHLGCGGQRREGFINIDQKLTGATDFVSDIAKLPVPPGAVARIETYHVIEHVPHRRVRAVLDGWLRLLEPGGALVVECPDLDADVREYLAGDRSRLFSIFGHQRYDGDTHFFGYSERSLRELLEDVGFTDVVARPPTDYHAQDEPCLRVEARAPSAPVASAGGPATSPR
jgi:predicted SAM-dependent methyltransferase